MKSLVLAAVFMAGLGSVASAADTYKCDFSGAGTGNWVPDVFFIKVDAENNSAAIRDGRKQGADKNGWRKAKIRRHTEKSVSVGWSIERMKSSTNQNVSMDYRVVIVKKTQKANVMIEPRGYRNTFQGKGRCAVLKG
ncbi:hypothetical protein NBRC116601_12300 [Cognatishimia sp. WU-CL00825]|uniref:hypothetical protein n=1 Tax=Cognatishimia sp. WU-CL00825 TaxID=3127658 RepID=UPI003101DF82